MKAGSKAAHVLTESHADIALAVAKSHELQRMAFVEAKQPDLVRVAELLEQCRAENMWANRGPLYARLKAGFATHMHLDAARAVVPCANGGVALEAMARLHDMRAGRRLRWVGSAFSFKNLGRGYFADMQFVDCTAQGMLDLEAVKRLDPDSWDGLVLVNPFGLAEDMSAYLAFAGETGRPLLIDNAAGLGPEIPDGPWQAFSLHHTKPYGMGEGGLAVVPAADEEELYALLNYGAVPADPGAWLNNGKLSDIACAFLIDRLEKHGDWAPRYLEQAFRVDALAREAGLAPLLPIHPHVPVTSRAYLWPEPLPAENLSRMQHVTCAKYYGPLAPLPQVTRLYARLVNIPVHPDMARVADAVLAEDLKILTRK